MTRTRFEGKILDLLQELGMPEDGGEVRELVFELNRLYRQGFLRLEELRERLERLHGQDPSEGAFFD